MLYRSFFTSLLLFAGLPAYGNDYESADTLKSSVELFLESTLSEELAIADPKDIEVSASNLDPRLKLKKCQGDIQPTIVNQKPYGANLSVKLSCNSNQRWSIYVPAKVRIYENIAVLTKNLQRGDVIQSDDLNLARMDTTSVGTGYVKLTSRLVGMQLKRRLSAGQAVRLGHVKAAKIINKGDKVVLEASKAGLSVVTSGLALSGGSVGQQIQVRNSHSKRVIEAKIVAPGRVRVIL